MGIVIPVALPCLASHRALQQMQGFSLLAPASACHASPSPALLPRACMQEGCCAGGRNNHLRMVARLQDAKRGVARRQEQGTPNLARTAVEGGVLFCSTKQSMRSGQLALKQRASVSVFSEACYPRPCHAPPRQSQTKGPPC